MPDPNPSTLSLGTVLLRWSVGVALLLALVVVVQRQIGWTEVLSAWSAMPPTILGFAFLCFATSHGARALRIHRYVGAARGMPLSATVKLSVLHQCLNNVLPMRLGELAFPVLLRRYGGVGLGEGVSNLVWLRLIDVVAMGCVALAVTGLLLPGVGPGMTAVMVALVGVAGTAVFVGNNVRGLLTRAGNGWLVRVLSQLLAAAPESLRLRWELLAWTVTAWLAKLVALLLVVVHTSQLDLLHALAGVLAGEASTLLPVHGLAGAGSYEAAFVTGALTSGLALEALLLVAVNAHLFTLTVMSVLALLALPVPVVVPALIRENP